MWFWATNLLEGSPVAQQGGSGQIFQDGPLFSLFFLPPSLNNLLLLPSCLSLLRSKMGAADPHQRVGAGGSGQVALKLLPVRSASHPHGPAGGLRAVSTSRECGCESPLEDLFGR